MYSVIRTRELEKLKSIHTWSDRGDRFIERIKSIYATAKLQQDNPFAILSGLIRNA